MPSTSSSSNPVSDALQNLTRAATVAFTTVQDQAQAEVAQARAERDDAVKALHEAQLDAKDLAMREEGWRSALEKADMTVCSHITLYLDILRLRTKQIKHQAETITQLRSEVHQWKTQLTRLEESSRQEIDDWKEQYRRAEHERSRLSARIDELISGQLAWNVAAHAYTPYTPRVAYTEIPEPSTSSSAPKRASTASHAPRTAGTPRKTARPPPDPEEPPLLAARKQRTATQAQSSRRAARADHSSTPRSRGGSPIRLAVESKRTNGNTRTPAARASPAYLEVQARSEPRQRVIRRVTAIVDVKEEEEEESLRDDESVRSGSVFEPDEEPQMPPVRKRRRASNASTRRKQVVQDWDWDEDEQTPDVDNAEEEYMEEEDDDDDDELLLGPKKTRTSSSNGRRSRPSVSAKSSTTTAAKNLKRKMDIDQSASGGRTGPAKTAKTR
ncbi:hypothetical protein BN946_scf184973.g2 [Trametes cinnabarina]|uniref:Uncharacterized protein n=1 Tax=Pycnoporus cinnabarinus TaxID=5643 RepID=A0A060S679_PYCCI|nr:hypothetical protein BN946_scf184973.g2 [Trametes cinnabarina]